MSEATSSDSLPSVSFASNSPTPPAHTAVHESHLRDALKRCSPATVEAAWAFRRTGDVRHIGTIVCGVIERYMDSDTRMKLGTVGENLRLSEDLGIDSLSLMEIVILAEDVFPITVHNEELCGLRTVGDITRFIASKLQVDPPTLAPIPIAS